MSSSSITESARRLNALKLLLSEGGNSTQEDLVGALNKQKYPVTQSTISRDLAKLGAIRSRDPKGRLVYKLPGDTHSPVNLPTSDLRGLLISVQHNGSMIVIQTPPGSASLVAHQLDSTKPKEILGTIAGDDTIFVAPRSTKDIKDTIAAILEQFS